MMVIVLTEGLPRTAPPMGVPRVNVSVRISGVSGLPSVPVMSSVVCPIRNTSGLAVTLSTAPSPVPPSVNGTLKPSATWLTVLLATLATQRCAARAEGQADGQLEPVGEVGTTPAGFTLVTVPSRVLAT